MHRPLRALFPAFALALATGAHADPVRIEHAQGDAVLPTPARRIAAYDLVALDILQALDAPVAAVPEVRMPAHLAADAADLPRVGSLFEPDTAALAALEPAAPPPAPGWCCSPSASARSRTRPASASASSTRCWACRRSCRR